MHLPASDCKCVLPFLCVYVCLKTVACKESIVDQTVSSITGVSGHATRVHSLQETLLYDDYSHSSEQGHTDFLTAIPREVKLKHEANVTPSCVTTQYVTVKQFVESNNITVDASANWKETTVGNYDNNDSGIAATPMTKPLAHNTSLMDAARPKWRHIMDVGVLSLASIGVVANTLTFVTLTVNGRHFSRLTALLLKHQALMDAGVCIIASGVFVQTSVWHLGQSVVDYAICFFWHSQFLFWVTVLLSVWNLVFIAADRLMAVCYPIQYKTLSPSRVKIAIVLWYAPCIVATLPCIHLVSFVHGRCTVEKSLNTEIVRQFYYWYSICWLMASYVLPVLCFTTFYGLVISQLRRHRIASAAQSQGLPKSTLRITKCSITLTAIFLATIGFDAIYFCAGHVGVVYYELGTPTQLAGLLATVCNSLANPFVYAIFMPNFRRSLLKTLCRRSNTATVQNGVSIAVIANTTV